MLRDIGGRTAYRLSVPKRRVTTTKRQREQAKRDRQQRKAERRAERAAQPADASVTTDADAFAEAFVDEVH